MRATERRDGQFRVACGLRPRHRLYGSPQTLGNGTGELSLRAVDGRADCLQTRHLQSEPRAAAPVGSAVNLID
jgi:hypothetical protein